MRDGRRNVYCNADHWYTNHYGVFLGGVVVDGTDGAGE